MEGYPVGKLVEAELDVPGGGSERFFVRENFRDSGSGRIQCFELTLRAHWSKKTFEYVASVIAASDPLGRPVGIDSSFSVFAARVAFGDFPRYVAGPFPNVPINPEMTVRKHRPRR